LRRRAAFLFEELTGSGDYPFRKMDEVDDVD